MATETLKVGGIFPAGTSVSAYAVSSYDHLPTSGTTGLGDAEATATVTSASTLTFTGLDHDQRYVAHASVSSVDKYLRFSTLTAQTIETSIDVTRAPYNADPTGADDSTTALNDALADGLEQGVLVRAAGTFYTTATITVGDQDIDFSAAKLLANVPRQTPTEVAAIRVWTGNTGGGNASRVLRRNLLLPRVWQDLPRVSGKAWWVTNGDGGDIGVQLVNVEGCNIDVPEVRDFSLGLDVTGRDSSGSVYSTIRVGQLTNNRINHRIGQLNTSGYSNSNVYVAGGYNHYSTEATERQAGTRHVYIQDISTATRQVDGNLWLGSSFEGPVAEYEIQCFGNENTWRDCRWEKQGSTSAITPRVLWSSNATFACTDNLIDGGRFTNLVEQVEQNGGATITRNGVRHMRKTEIQNGQKFYRAVGLPIHEVHVTGETFPRIARYSEADYAGGGTLAPDVKWSRPSGAGNVGILRVEAAGAATRATLRVKRHASQTGTQHLVEVTDESNVTLGGIGKDGRLVTLCATAPADADLATGELAIWFDKTAGAAKMMMKAKNASGTVVTGQVALS